MLLIEIAGLNVGLCTETPYILRCCAPFAAQGTPDFTVAATPEEIAAERELSGCGAAVAEFACLYRQIAERLPDYDRFVLHGAAIQTGGSAYVFTAKSGTGKTTHIRLWRERYGEAVRIVNGDKPVIWRKDGLWYACGTPWCGKEGLTSRDCVPVAGLCLLERAATNRIQPASSQQIAEAIFHQIYRPKDTARLLRFLSLLDGFLSATPVWRMGCNMEVEAAELAHDAMTGNGK